jgi:LacI family transcriptional regulator, repressor for deo operon, udp, cdd, tsx, nupC, and nupG
MAATLEDVARSAGVSIATVSRVFNARPNVAEGTRAAVAEAIERLGYRGQQGLVANRHAVVGVLLSDPESTLLGNIARAFVEVLATTGVSVLRLQAAPATVDERASEIFFEHRVSGIAILNSQRSAIELQVPRYSPARNDQSTPGAAGIGSTAIADSLVAWDDLATIRLAAEQLLAAGHTAIGYVARSDDWESVNRRIAEFESVIDETGSQGRRTGTIERASSSVEAGELACRRLLDSGATGIVCETDWMAVGALRGIKASRKHMPEDVALISCEDSRVLAELDPPITAVRQPAGALGRAAALELTRQMEDPSARGSEQVFRPEVVSRGSIFAPTNAAAKVRRRRRRLG